jgi:exonuclease SbcC
MQKGRIPVKILKLRLKNLNSLVGEWTIDFSHPDFEGNKIFAIVGPTGAGKTTLLDAICLALYGRTPRLPVISATTNELMARQTGECLAEVTFETHKGIYRSLWAQQCARKKAGEKLQQPRREIVEALSGNVLETHSKRVDTCIEMITGMDFNRFTRSMMLAQGEFDAFLKAAPGERAPILEQITGTEIYSTISKAVFERLRSEELKLKELTLRLSEIQLLSPDDEQSLLEEVAEKKKQNDAHIQEIQKLETHRNWRQALDSIALKRLDLEGQWHNYLAEAQDAAGSLMRLENGLKALNSEGSYRDLIHLKNLQDDEQRKLADIHLQCNHTESALTNSEKAWLQAQGSSTEAQKAHSMGVELSRQVRDLDSEIAKKRDKLAAVQGQISDLQADIANRQKSISTLDQASQEAVEKRTALQASLEGSASDEKLVENFVSISSSLERLKDKRLQLQHKAKIHDTCQEKWLQVKQHIENLSDDFKTAQEALEAKNRALQIATETCSQLAGERTPLQWEEERKSLTKLQELYSHLKDAMADHASAVAQHESALSQIATCQQLLGILKADEEQHKAQCEENSLEIEQLEGQQLAYSRMQTLNEQRLQLVDQQPCPLCGSLEHPFAHGSLPDFGDLPARLKRCKLQRQELGKRTLQLGKEIAAKETELHNFKQLLAKQESAILTLQGKVDAYLKNVAPFNSPEPFIPTASWAIEQQARVAEQYAAFEQTHTAYLSSCSRLEKAQSGASTAQESYSVKEREMGALSNAQAINSTERTNAQKALEECEQEHNLLKEALQAELIHYGIYHLDGEPLEEIKKSLQLRLENWKKHRHEINSLDAKTIELNSKKNTEKIHLEQQIARLAELEAHCSQILEELASGMQQRHELYGDRKPDVEEDRLAKSVELANQAYHLAKTHHASLLQRKESLNQELARLREATARRQELLQAAENNFMAQIKAAGFEDIDGYTRAAMPYDERERLSKLKSHLEGKKSQLYALREQADNQIKILEAEALTDEPLDMIISTLAKVTALQSAARGRIAIIDNSLAENEKKKFHAEAIKLKFDKQKIENNLWGNLSELIGSADGKKFRNIAQKMTLNMMVAHANRQLQKLNDRYLLKQSDKVDLELEVIDNYQGGEERSVKNLSGGESFIVSLALALGLSQMASRQVRVDSLFLDEGFGSLDEKALEIALETLMQLQQDGKIIGLISHVTALKERIATQIAMQPLSGGRSRIDGPGVLQV